jgi:hypothetical protein
VARIAFLEVRDDRQWDPQPLSSPSVGERGTTSLVQLVFAG